MKIAAVYLSNRKGSVSELCLDALTAGAEEAGAEVYRYKVGSTILGCRGCRACQSGAEQCVLKDGLEDYFTQIRDADVLIVGTANYMGDVQGQAVSFMNRHYCMADTSKGMGNRIMRLSAGKKLIGVFAQGAVNKEAYLEPYRRYLGHFKAYGMEAEEPIVVNAADCSEEALAALREQGRKLAE